MELRYTLRIIHHTHVPCVRACVRVCEHNVARGSVGSVEKQVGGHGGYVNRHEIILDDGWE